MGKLIDITSYPLANVLDLLLADKSTKKNIIWATDTYEEFGEGFSDKVQINARLLLRHADIIRPRIQKSLEAQAARTRKKAEVFSPAWLCNQMNNRFDDDWFGRTGVFNVESGKNEWAETTEKIEFPDRKKWQDYVDSRRLEITCGEAPYLVSRYDVSTGKPINPTSRRVGILDRKLRIVNENTDTYNEWLKWTTRAFEATYGYEYQGDSVLIARANLLSTFVDYYEKKWQQRPDDNLLRNIANIIAWNIWQMDGLKDTVPLGKPYVEYEQFLVYDIPGVEDKNEDTPKAAPCYIYNWRSRSNRSMRFMDVKEMYAMGEKLFDYVIGNPPYQEETVDTSDKPVYNIFMDASYQVADKVELITPARFLFNAGKTPKAWNQKMLADEHFKVLHFEQDSSKVFPNTDIKGGVAITYHDNSRDFGAIEVFSHFDELNTIRQKVVDFGTFESLSDIIYAPESYKFTNEIHTENSWVVERLSKGHLYDITSNIFEKIPELLFDEKPCDNDEYVGLYGLIKKVRATKWIKRKYIKNHDNLDYYKVFVPKANGSGAIGEILSTPVIGQPVIGHTQTFISIGCFKTEAEATALLKYIKTKFARTLLGVLKITQDNKKGVWKYVPQQDFTPSSDIDWSKSIHEIDLQLYRKYGLDEKEIEFIETHVKEMA